MVRFKWRDPTRTKRQLGFFKFDENGVTVEAYRGDVEDYAEKVGPARRRNRDPRVHGFMASAERRKLLECIPADAPPPAPPAPAPKAAEAKPPAPPLEPPIVVPGPPAPMKTEQPAYAITEKGKAFVEEMRAAKAAKAAAEKPAPAPKAKSKG
jgi:hypothetical protein